MKNVALVMVFGLFIGTVAQAGYRFDVDKVKALCLQDNPRSTEALQEINASIVSTLKASCEEHPGAVGAISTLESVEIQEKGACGFGLDRYEYHVTASCYIP